MSARREPREQFNEYVKDRPDCICPLCGHVGLGEWHLPDKYKHWDGKDRAHMECDECGSWTMDWLEGVEESKESIEDEWREGWLVRERVEKELLPCPICGEKVTFEEFDWEGNGCLYHTYIYCKPCELMMETYQGYRAARDRWNNRRG